MDNYEVWFAWRPVWAISRVEETTKTLRVTMKLRWLCRVVRVEHWERADIFSAELRSTYYTLDESFRRKLLGS